MPGRLFWSFPSIFFLYLFVWPFWLFFIIILCYLFFFCLCFVSGLLCWLYFPLIYTLIESLGRICLNYCKICFMKITFERRLVECLQPNYLLLRKNHRRPESSRAPPPRSHHLILTISAKHLRVWIFNVILRKQILSKNVSLANYTEPFSELFSVILSGRLVSHF